MRGLAGSSSSEVFAWVGISEGFASDHRPAGARGLGITQRGVKNRKRLAMKRNEPSSTKSKAIPRQTPSTSGFSEDCPTLLSSNEGVRKFSLDSCTQITGPEKCKIDHPKKKKNSGRKPGYVLPGSGPVRGLPRNFRVGRERESPSEGSVWVVVSEGFASEESGRVRARAPPGPGPVRGLPRKKAGKSG